MSRTVKGMVHALLAAAAIAEASTAVTRKRKFLLGLATGYHLQSVVYHWVYEQE